MMQENSDNINKNSSEQENENQDNQNQTDNISSELQNIIQISGMYKDWFLDYASYVILERAVPHLNDGLKPVQRRILHSMKKLDDGRYNKVANIIGNTMQYHPHGDASIGDALVQLGQKDLLVDTQGNWGNTATGDRSAAPRYIEARLSKFALDVVFNPKTTEWKSSYDGRNKEPITLPIKFPLLLAQGVEGIAVGLASKILPHNFNELIDASINHLTGKEFCLYPDFPTGGYADFSKYNNGIRGGSVKVRAKISKADNKTLVVSELPFAKNTSNLIESILKANEKGKIKIKKIDDNTSDKVEILIHLQNGTSPDKTIDALYAFTDCEISISPNSCVIYDNKPVFLGVNEMLKNSTKNTLNLLKKELEIRKNELLEAWHLSSLEKIFIENRIYNNIEECETWKSVIDTIDKGLNPFKELFKRRITQEDIVHLTEIKIKRISKYDSKKADEYIKNIEEEIKEVDNYLNNIIDYTINYFKQIKKKFGKGRERKTEIRTFETIIASKVVEANEKLFVNRKEGFLGTSLKKDEFVCNCSDIDDIIIILKNGDYLITKVADKSFVGKDIIHVNVFKKNDDRTIYNAIYRDGKNGVIMMKRFAIKGLTRDKEYNLTKGTEDSKILYFSVNPNGEAETVKVNLKPKPKLKKLIIEIDFSLLAIKGRSSIGNILTKHQVHKISLKEKGFSTLGGRKIWFDEAVLRLNSDERGKYLGEFLSDDKILVICKTGIYKLHNFDLSNHFEDDILIIEKFNPEKIFSCVYFNAEYNFYYLKRFDIEVSDKMNSFIGENSNSKMITLSDDKYPRIEVVFGGENDNHENEIINVEEFIGIKSYKAKGKRISAYDIKKIKTLDPIIKEEEIEEEEPLKEEILEETDSFEKDNIEKNDEKDDAKKSAIKGIIPDDDDSQMSFNI
ncbi:MAG: DNA gyrase/topoisomerase IV subunit A [Bacteroidetes bacterium]|nr:DNA gyrase/topoisomerase IV subunit A [Bacteroidota bacterium]